MWIWLRSKPWTAVAAVLLVVLLLGWPGWTYHWNWTGFGESFGKPKNAQGLRDYYPSKTLWDWMQLLLVPAVLAGAAGWLSWEQQRRVQKSEAKREQDSVLDSYLTQIGDLLLHEKLGESPDAEKARYVARAQTSTAVRRLDSSHTAIIVRFLSESNLIKVLDLSGATLGEADLSLANLSGAELSKADLSLANLSEAELSEADLTQADLTQANLARAKLSGANLRIAKLGRVDLRLAKLHGADLTGAILDGANLTVADLTGANLSNANLSQANLSGANLS